MAFAPGTRFGPYEVLLSIGSGGMGEVYRARDTRLDRTVALKVLPSHLAENPDLRKRFEREARAVASLNHPNICALYDVGHQDGLDFIVMEFLEGETLAGRIRQGPLPVPELLRSAVQIADALDAAHRQGLVHRDLKPGNVMLTRTGVKLLDFGLAKWWPIEDTPAFRALSSGGAEETPVRQSLTAQGTILGTLHYMSPEQLESREADARSDIFALGAVIHEMATGRKAFEGGSPASLIGAILHHTPPPLSTLEPVVPQALDRVVQTCLAKDPNDRWQGARDLARELRWVTASVSQPDAALRPRASRERWAWALAAGLLVASAGLALALWQRLATAPKVIRFAVPAPAGLAWGFTSPGRANISPDGRMLALVATRGGEQSRVWLRDLASLELNPLPGTEGATGAFWSPDSEQIGFFSDGKLKRLRVPEGLPQQIVEANNVLGASWGRGGDIVFTPGNRDVLYRVAAEGGTPEPVTAFDAARGENTHRWPSFLPDGRHFVYLARSREPDKNAIYVGALGSSDRKRLLDVDSNAVYLPPGYLLFARGELLLAQRFDLGGLKLVGEPFSVAEPISFAGSGGSGAFSASGEGTLAYQMKEPDTNWQLTWFERTGKPIGPLGGMGVYTSPVLSLDGRRIAVVRADPATRNPDIWAIEWPRGTASRLTYHPGVEHLPLWSPDGTRLAFSSNRDGPADLYVRHMRGAGEDQLLLKTPHVKRLTSWSRDGRFILFDVDSSETRGDLWVLPIEGDRQPRPYLQTPAYEGEGQFSPDGRWVAFATSESGRVEVALQPFPATGEKQQVSTEGGYQPRWRQDGRELYYLTLDGKLMAVEVTSRGPELDLGSPHLLFDTRVRERHGEVVYTPDARGECFLVDVPVGDTPPSPVVVVVNWAAGLER